MQSLGFAKCSEGWLQTVWIYWHHWCVQLEMIKIVNFVMCFLPKFKKKRTQKLPGLTSLWALAWGIQTGDVREGFLSDLWHNRGSLTMLHALLSVISPNT